MKRVAIEDKKIIELYKAGYSQNDIAKQYDVSVVYTRSVLNAAGFNTRGYRALSPAAIKVIETLVNAGVRYVDIEAVCDLSFHAIRDYVDRSGCRSIVEDVLITDSFPGMSEFLKAYREGNSFCFLVEKMSLEEHDILSAFSCIKKEDVTEHRVGLRHKIEKYQAEGLSNAGITRILNISRSIIRNGVK